MTGAGRFRGPWGLFGALAAVFAVEGAVAGLDADLTRPERNDWRFTRRAAGREAPGADVLCLGSSMVQMGVDPGVVERRGAGRGYNLASCGGRVEAAYYALRRALAAGARPRAVVIDLHPAFITEGYRHGTPAWADALGPADALELAWAVGDPDAFTASALARALPTVDHRQELRAALAAALGGRPFSLAEVSRGLTRNRRAHRGAIVGPEHADHRGEVSEAFRALFLGDDRPVDPVVSAYFGKILDLSARHGARVYALLLPLTPGLQADREARGLDGSYTRKVGAFLRHPNLAVLDARRSGHGPSAFLDACHLGPTGNRALSAAVADAVRGRGPSARWVHLPRDPGEGRDHARDTGVAVGYVEPADPTPDHPGAPP